MNSEGKSVISKCKTKDGTTVLAEICILPRPRMLSYGNHSPKLRWNEPK